MKQAFKKCKSRQIKSNRNDLKRELKTVASFKNFDIIFLLWDTMVFPNFVNKKEKLLAS